MSHPLASDKDNRASQYPIYWQTVQGLRKMLFGNRDEAIGIWVSLLKLDSPKPRLYIVRKLIQVHVYAEVKEYLEGFADKPLDNQADVKYWLARSYYGLGLLTDALSAIDAAVRIGPEKAVYWDLKADCYLELGDWKQAAESLNRCLRVDPKRAETIYRLGTVYAYNGEYAEALRCFTGACQLRPSMPSYWEMKAEMQLQLEDIAGACANFSRALRYRVDPEVMARTAYCLIQLNKLDKGMKYYERVLKLEPDHYDALCNLAAIYQNQGRPNEALPLLERAHSIYPNDPILLNNLAYTFVHLGRLRKAIEYYRAAMDLAPGHPLILYNFSVCLAHKGEWKAGIEIINKILEINPEHSDAWVLLGNIYEELDRPELAIDCFNRALKLA